jgi:hypothetical protein
VRNDLDLAVTLLRDLDGLAEVSHATVHLDLLVQELLEGGDIEDLVAGRLGGVDDELRKLAIHPKPTIGCHWVWTHLLGRLGGLSLAGLLLYHEK